MAPSATLNLLRVGDKLVKRAKRIRVTRATVMNARASATRSAQERAEDQKFFGYRMPI